MSGHPLIGHSVGRLRPDMPHVNEREELVTHLTDLITSRLLDPLEILLEADLDEIREQIATRAAALAAVLNGENEQQAAYTAIRLVAALYPSDGPFRPTVAWWGEPRLRRR
ncbi:hypothetical protein ACWKSP_13945 [Micromonosporaceae bacterium Da 78-11]